MEANELRIGNFVLVDNAKSHPNLLNEPVIVVGINKRYEKNFPNSNATISFEIDKYNGGSQFNEFIKPIELTEQWILKFTYIKLNNKYFTIQGHLIWICNDLFMCDKNGIVLKYVHQLQNLYFALTGQELNIKE